MGMRKAICSTSLGLTSRNVNKVAGCSPHLSAWMPGIGLFLELRGSRAQARPRFQAPRLNTCIQDLPDCLGSSDSRRMIQPMRIPESALRGRYFYWRANWASEWANLQLDAQRN